MLVDLVLIIPVKYLKLLLSTSTQHSVTLLHNIRSHFYTTFGHTSPPPSSIPVFLLRFFFLPLSYPW